MDSEDGGDPKMGFHVDPGDRDSLGVSLVDGPRVLSSSLASQIPITGTTDRDFFNRSHK